MIELKTDFDRSDRALSRSGKNVLHVDKNPYYGGPEASFSVQDAQKWVDQVNKGR